METKIQLLPLQEEHTIAMKEEMQEAFQHGFQAYQKDDGEEGSNHWQVLPDEDFYQSLRTEGAEAYEAVDADGQRVGGTIITVNDETCEGELMEQREQSQAGLSFAESRQKSTVGQLAFLYVKVGIQSRGIGQAIWKAIEAMHPEVEVWETCTPYFDRRNIHFYINRCGFHAIEFYNAHHHDPNMPEPYDEDDGMFVFEKRMKNK